MKPEVFDNDPVQAAHLMAIYEQCAGNDLSAPPMAIVPAQCARNKDYYYLSKGPAQPRCG